VSGAYVARLRAAHPSAVIVDLSGDLRLPSAAAYKSWYGHEHPAPELLGQAPYGLTEVFRDRLAGARTISNPGCYATGALLPLVPLLLARLADPSDVIVDAKSGATGAGRALREELLFCEVTDDFSAYSPGRSHRHVAEIEAALELATGVRTLVTFCPHLLPVKRGILSALYLRTAAGAGEVKAALRSFYSGSPFVHVGDGNPPRLSDVAFTNECRISAHDAAPGRVVVFSAIDNLVKGAAGQAIQNLNLAMGFPETAGLL
jgi:N-acetyl-gamma-glutamyl-phosphate reductase